MNRTAPTSPSPTPRRQARRPARPRRAFTLVELLTVILILAILMSILAPAITKVRQIAMIKASQTTINALDAACNLYRDDFGDFPPSQDLANFGTSGDSGGAWWGSQLLALFLQGYGPDTGTDGTPATNGRLDQDDGKEGPGFRIMSRGKVYGPYNDADKLPFTGKFEDPRNASALTAAPRFFVDAFDHPIVYYRFTGTAYDPSHNGVLPYMQRASDLVTGGRGIWPTPGPTRAPYDRTVAGSIDLYARNNVTNGAYLRKDFLLISRGPDGGWCWNGPVSGSDDVTNMFPSR